MLLSNVCCFIKCQLFMSIGFTFGTPLGDISLQRIRLFFLFCFCFCRRAFFLSSIGLKSSLGILSQEDVF